MKIQAIIRALLTSLALSIVAYVIISWPLAIHVAEGIPSSAQNIEDPPVRRMMPGDHLQLMYHFDLVRDMFTGRIPWWHNVYEFNTGNDADRFRPGSYFMPFSLVYAAVAGLSGQAAAWNLVQFLSVWGSVLFSWIWLRRFTSDRWVTALGVFVIVLSPFRWISLFGGSPSGFALVWVQLFALAVDQCVRKPLWSSGFSAGLVLLLLLWADIHVFYFTVLAAPLFVLIRFYADGGVAEIPWRRWPRVLPGLFFFGGIMALFMHWRKSNIAGSTMGQGRSAEEIINYSPRPSGFISGGAGCDDWIFLGLSILLVLVAGIAAAVIRDFRRKDKPMLHVSILLIVAVALGMFALLSLGYRGPARGLALDLARDLVPGYAMIRQPAKIFAVVPLLAAWLIVTGWSRTTGASGLKVMGLRALLVLAASGMIYEFGSRFATTICLLDDEQPVYQRVAAPGETPRALVIPLWPGESADTSVPIYYAHKYNIRLVNGYSPVVSRTYFEEVFRRLESMNQGHVTDDQIDFLLATGVRHLFLHENLYPENVSPFPVYEALRRLRAHPRIRSAGQSGPVHGFTLLEAGVAANPTPPSEDQSSLFPTRRWEVERLSVRANDIVTDTSASAGAAWRASSDGLISPKPVRVAPAGGLAWWIRARGAGSLAMTTKWGERQVPHEPVAVQSADWQWHIVAIPEQQDFDKVTYSLGLVSGAADVDAIFLGPDDWPVIWPPAGISIPAAHLFRGGYSDADGASVVFNPDEEQNSVRLYGPRLPVPPGSYRLEVAFTATAPAGTIVGQVQVMQGADTPRAAADLVAGTPLELRWETDSNLPVSFHLRYDRKGTLTIHSLSLVADDGILAK